MPTPPGFIIGVFSQPTSSFAKWKARGINTLVSHEPEGGRIKKADWESAATAAGFWFMDYPSDDPATMALEAQQPMRLAFMQDDEPDLTRELTDARNIPDGPYKGWRKPEPFVARYQACKAAAPNMPVFCNFAGPQVTPDAYTHGGGHLPYLAVTDWVAHDWYVKNKNWQRYPVSLIKKAYDRLAAWSGNKTQFVFIECSDQKISPLGRLPTADEVEEEVNLAVSLGARGIIYFPQRPPPGFQFDAMPPDVATRVVAINARLGGTVAPGPMPPVAPPVTPPPAPQPTGPSIADLLTRLDGLSARLDTLSRDVEALKAKRYWAKVELQSGDA
jgi:hypothetical protein